MASWDDVRRIALDLPETDEGTSHGNRSWRVKEKGFVWERPLRAVTSRRSATPRRTARSSARGSRTRWPRRR